MRAFCPNSPHAFSLFATRSSIARAVAHRSGCSRQTVPDVRLRLFPPAAAEAGKDVVHQLNSAFTKVFEIVAPSVVIIEVTKKNDGNENLDARRSLFPKSTG